jgi:hypothetical protein
LAALLAQVQAPVAPRLVAPALAVVPAEEVDPVVAQEEVADLAVETAVVAATLH